MSVTAVTFTARSVHSRAADPDTLHFRGPAAARARSMAVDILPAVACPSTATAPTRYSRREAWLRRHSCFAGACGAILCCGFRALSFLSVRLPWRRWVQPSRVSSLTASRSSFDCLASSTDTETRGSARSRRSGMRLSSVVVEISGWVSSPMRPRPAFATASATLLSR